MIFYHVRRIDGFISKLFVVFPDNSFKLVDNINIRIDRVLESPLSIQVNYDENSLTINSVYGILFTNSFALSEFIDELYFTMETLHNVKANERHTKNITNILDLEEHLNPFNKIQGEEDGEKEKFDDRKTRKE